MSRAENLAPAEAAAEAVKAYLRQHKERIVEDVELLALLPLERFGENANVADFQRFVIEKLIAENTALKAARDGLRFPSARAELMREGVRKLVLDLIDARGVEQAIAVATGAASALKADAVALGVESKAPLRTGQQGMSLLPLGLSDGLIERDAAGALIKGGAHLALFAASEELNAVAVYRLDLGPHMPPALYAVGARDAGRFDDSGETHEMIYFVRTLERTIRAWLEQPTT